MERTGGRERIVQRGQASREGLQRGQHQRGAQHVVGRAAASRGAVRVHPQRAQRTLAAGRQQLRLGQQEGVIHALDVCQKRPRLRRTPEVKFKLFTGRQAAVI